MLGAITILTLAALLAIGITIIEIRHDEQRLQAEKLRRRAEEALAIQRSAKTRRIDTAWLDELDSRAELDGLNKWLDM